MFQDVGENMANCSKDEELKEESEELLIFAPIPDGVGDPYIKLTWWNLVSSHFSCRRKVKSHHQRGYIRQAHSQSVLADVPSSLARLARS